MNKNRYLSWREGMIFQHKPEGVKSLLNGMFEYSQVRCGEFKKGEGDIVIINVGKNNFFSLEEYLNYCLMIDRLETKGVYTIDLNIFH